MPHRSQQDQETVERLQHEAAAFALQGVVEKASGLYKQLLLLDSQHFEALRFLGMAHLQQQDYNAAINYLEQALTQKPDGMEMLFSLAMAYYELKNMPKALSILERCLQMNARHLRALLYKGMALEQTNEVILAISAFFRAVKLAEIIPVDTIKPQTRQLLAYASAAVRTALDAEIGHALMPIVAQHGEDAIARIRACADIFVGKIKADSSHPQWNPGLMFIPGLPPRPFLERSEFPFLAELEKATPVIREELIQAMTDNAGFAPYIDIEPGTPEANIWHTLNRSEAWSSFHFYRHGKQIESHCIRCPNTSAILQRLNLMHVPGYGPEVMFSVLKPKTRIQPHYGSVNGRLVVHLPLIVPAQCGAIRVCDEQRSWTEGECLIFDDSFEHEAWNDSDETRVVLILDIWNPALSTLEREAFSTLLQTAQAFERRHEGSH